MYSVVQRSCQLPAQTSLMTELLIACNGSFRWYQWAAATEKLSTSINIMHWEYYYLLFLFKTQLKCCSDDCHFYAHKVQTGLQGGKNVNQSLLRHTVCHFSLFAIGASAYQLDHYFQKLARPPGKQALTHLNSQQEQVKKHTQGVTQARTHTHTQAQSQAALHLTNSSWNVACSEKKAAAKVGQREKTRNSHSYWTEQKVRGDATHLWS